MTYNAKNVIVEDKENMRRLIYAIVLFILSTLVVCAQDYETAFYDLQKDFEYRSSTIHNQIEIYLTEYPYTPYVDEVHTMQGVLLSEKKQYSKAIEAFEKANVNNLSRTIEPLYYFHMGYAYMQLLNFEKALEYLLPLKTNPNSPFALQASYYAGYCYYKLKEYNNALVEFLGLEHIGGYRNIAPYYIVQIHYALSEYEKVLDRAERLITEFPNNEYNDELHRMMGEIYYQDSIYDKAATHLEEYHTLRITNKRPIVRNDLYLLGISNYRIANYNQAIKYLKQIKQENDSISESCCLHLGHSYLRVNDIEKAILAYSAAIQFGINPILREEAMYNFIQATYLKNSALGESITAFQTFIQEYPCSKYIDKVYALMADMYLTSKNYLAALNSLQEIQQPSDKVLQTCQYLRYQLAADAFLQNKMDETIKWAEEIIIKESNESTYKTEAYYLCAQAYYRLHKYPQSIEHINLFQQQASATLSNNLKTATYLNAYAHFNQKDYTAADPLYRNYISMLANDTTNTTYPDALNRLGDCLFHERKFQEASRIYKQVANLNSIGTDYALLQDGYTQGLMHKYTEKVNVLTTLIQQHPFSDYADDALYEIARAELQQEHHPDAIKAYQQLLNNYPNSNRAVTASLELGMTYRAMKQYDEAIQAFKVTISTYTGSEEAYSALEGLEQIYVETNNIDEYIAYTKTLTNINMQSISSEDSLIYTTAELQYLMGNYQQAVAGFATYITTFCPGGRYCTNATYYAANSFYQLHQFEQAIEQYSTLADIPGNPYLEEACMRVAELSYDKQSYRTALYYFQRMSEVASSNNKRIIALLGMLRCSYNIEEQTKAIEVATSLIEEPNIDSVIRNEALYCRAKVHIKNKQYGLAIVDLNSVAKEVRTTQGAEAKYLLAECYYQLNAIDTAEQEIMSFTQQQTSHQYWLAKSLILLADINITKNELFQAKQYLLALQKNYHTQDDILTTIEEKLALIDQLEIQQTNDTTLIQQL